MMICIVLMDMGFVNIDLLKFTEPLHLSQQIRDFLHDRITHRSENNQSFLVRSFDSGWILETQVNTFSLPQPQRTVLRCVIADSNNDIKIHFTKLIGMFGCAVVYDANFLQNLNCFWMHIPGRFGSGRESPPIFKKAGIDYGFGHL